MPMAKDWTWPSVATEWATIADTTARRIGIVDIQLDQRPEGEFEVAATRRAPQPGEILRCPCCGKQVEAENLLVLPAGTIATYPWDVICAGAIATLERQGDVVISTLMAVAGAPAPVVAAHIAEEARRGPRRRFSRRKTFY